MIDLALGVLAIAFALALLYGWSKSRKQTPSTGSPIPVASHSAIQRPASQMPILDAQALIQRTGTGGVVEKIRTSMGLLPANFDNDVLPLIHQFVEYVQLLPASESHHHAQPGGLLIHTLDVASHALKYRLGYKLPKGAAPEDQIRLGPVWTFGVLVAALLHDIGKPVADVKVKVYGKDPHKEVAFWNGLTGSMVQLAKVSGVSHYTVEFNAAKNYQAHQRMGTTLLHALLPASALQWLGSDAALLNALMVYLDGNATEVDGESASENPIREMVRKADQLSVADNLKHGPRTRFATARSQPLIERLMAGLRSLLAENLIPINRPGAPAYVDPDGIHIWLVAGTIADKVRQHLDAREKRSEGDHVGIPADNTRLFDTWQEYGALVEPPKEFGKGSVWWVRFEIDDWNQVLTVLKFPLSTLYQTGTPVPQALRGTATPVAPTTQRAVTSPQPGEATAVGMDTDDGAPLSEPASPPPQEPNASVRNFNKGLPDFLDEPSFADLVPPPAATPAAEPEFLESHEDAASQVVAHSNEPTGAVQALHKTNRAPRAPFKLPGSQPRPNADKFVAWIQNGLGTGELNYNESDAVLHFVPEGLAILSPKAFKLYLESHEWVGDLGDSKDTFMALQTHLQKSGYLLFNKEAKNYFHWYRVTKQDGSPGALLTVYLISNPQAYVRPVPSTNPLLTRTSKPAKKGDKQAFGRPSGADHDLVEPE